MSAAIVRENMVKFGYIVIVYHGQYTYTYNTSEPDVIITQMIRLKTGESRTCRRPITEPASMEPQHLISTRIQQWILRSANA